MSISTAILPEFQHETANTRRTLERIPPPKLDWGPHEKSMTLRGLASHLANIPNWGHLVLEDDHFDLEPPGQESTRVAAAESLEEVFARFDSAVDRASGAISSASDSTWGEGWSLLTGGQTLFTMPRIQVMRSMVLNHLIHHRGQLTVYLRMCEVPVPALYGPSADEASFGS